ncbi:hypothetical protein [Ramlibacter albus]|uniref:Uncharacterized protein n=1 Tax=Ramlibacter albus TaxID=2079448 RepID=A0A923M6G8_9BURK|nr:hypothetical protein [Ramlibacter albus]MBC5764718.1 hypothetical protein [Ramlibacter albus]
MKSLKALGAALVAAAVVVPAMAQQAAVVTSGTGIAVTSGTGMVVTPGTRMELIPGATIRNGQLTSVETVAVTDTNTAIMGAPAGSTVTVYRYAGPVPPANGYLAGDYQRYLALGK